LFITRVDRLYDRRSRVRAALNNVGRVPAMKMTVALLPARR
jgi:hypothetical protein